LERPRITSALASMSEDTPVITATPDLDEALQAEAKVVILAIYNIRDKQQSSAATGQHHSAACMVKIAHAAAMFYYLMDDIEKAKEFGRRAVGASDVVQDENYSRSIVDFLKVCENIQVVAE